MVTFWPHPRTVLQQDARDFRILSSLEEKKALLAAYKRMFDPFKARRDELEKDPDALEDILREGAKKARAAAAPVMEKVRRAVGL